jgi:hypothetical protein
VTVSLFNRTLTTLTEPLLTARLMKRWFKMGNAQSAPPQDRNGPLFAGHYPGDFSLRASLATIHSLTPTHYTLTLGARLTLAQRPQCKNLADFTEDPG